MPHDALEYALLRLGEKQSAAQVKKMLMKGGLTPSQADQVLEIAKEARKVAFKKQGLKRMLWGGLAFTIGTGASLYTYLEASSRGGGSYVLFSGLLAVGGVYAVVGLVQYMNGWDVN